MSNLSFCSTLNFHSYKNNYQREGQGAGGCVVDWSTALQASRSLVRYPM